MEEFEINASDGFKERTFSLRALGDHWYEILENGILAGEIKIDQWNHDHFHSVGCILDLPILSSIRKSIFIYKVFGGVLEIDLKK